MVNSTKSIALILFSALMFGQIPSVRVITGAVLIVLAAALPHVTELIWKGKSVAREHPTY